MEVSGASTVQGYQAALGQKLDIPEYAFYDKSREDKISLMIMGNQFITKMPYENEEDIRHLVEQIRLKPVKIVEQRRVDSRY